VYLSYCRSRKLLPNFNVRPLTEADFYATTEQLADQFDRLKLPVSFRPLTFPVREALRRVTPATNGLPKRVGAEKKSDAHDEQRQAPGTEKCIAIVYQGDDAVRKIRDVLGPTDPSKAPPGSIRREFGQTIMINAAHASDSAKNAKREMQIVQVSENNLKPLIENFYARP